MHRSLRRLQNCPSSAQIPSNLFRRCSAAIHCCRTRYRLRTALVLPYASTDCPNYRVFSSSTIPPKPHRSISNAPPELTRSSEPLPGNEDGGLGQREARDTAQSVQGARMVKALADHSAKSVLGEGEPDRTASTLPHNLTHQPRGAEASWEYFLELHGRGEFSPIIGSRAEPTRNGILKAALSDKSRMAILYEVAQRLQDDFGYDWPELYTRVIHHYLGKAEYDAAYMWHLRLMPSFTPTVSEFGVLLASFGVNATRELHMVLEKLYTFSPLRRVYDYLIPPLFECGQSQTARTWRKFLVLFDDLPSTSRSRPFLQFCIRYYPGSSLTDRELAIVREKKPQPTKPADATSTNSKARGPKGIYGDSFTARWFASSWASVEFAIDLMYKLGLRAVGPRSLQSLALRETDVEEVTSRIVQLEKLGIAITPTIYCKTLVSLAKQGRQDLLTELVHCDVHPEEFDDGETRRMLLYAAKRQENTTRQDLLEEIECIAHGGSKTNEKPLSRNRKPQGLNKLFETTLAKRSLGRARLVLDEMESANISISQGNANKLLDYVFKDLWFHPKKSQQQYFGKGNDPELDRAIQITRRVARHDVAVPLLRWRIILYNLGRLGRFEELNELSHEIVDMYSLAPEGLLPVHALDLPPRPASESATANRNSTARKGADQPAIDIDEVSQGRPSLMESFWKQEMGFEPEGPIIQPERELMPPKGRKQQGLFEPKKGRYYIPADLPLSHQQHPVAKLFDSTFQRAVVRWSFDGILTLPSTTKSVVRWMNKSPADFDVAWGVHFLATLRDKGLHVDKQVLRSTLYARIAVATVPGRSKHRSRDERELAGPHLKRLIDDAWGSELMPALPAFLKQLEDQKPKAWKQYPRLFMKAYDREGFQEMVDQKWSRTRQNESTGA